MFRTVTEEIMDGPNVSEPRTCRPWKAFAESTNSPDRPTNPRANIANHAAEQSKSALPPETFACGGGDVPIAVATAAKSHGISIDLTLLDRSPTALRRAASAANDAGITCHTIQADVLSDLPDSNFDVVTSTLFLHHIPQPAQVIELLNGIAASPAG